LPWEARRIEVDSDPLLALLALVLLSEPLRAPPRCVFDHLHFGRGKGGAHANAECLLQLASNTSPFIQGSGKILLRAGASRSYEVVVF